MRKLGALVRNRPENMTSSVSAIRHDGDTSHTVADGANRPWEPSATE